MSIAVNQSALDRSEPSEITLDEPAEPTESADVTTLDDTPDTETTVESRPIEVLDTDRTVRPHSVP